LGRLRTPDDRLLDEAALIGYFDRSWRSALNNTVADRFESIARLFPERIAVRDRARSLTYAEFSGLVQLLAEATAEVVATRPGPVAVLLPHEARFPVAILAVLTAGRGFTALDANDPAERIKLIAAHASASAVVSAGRLAQKARRLFPNIPVLDIETTDASRKKTDRSKADDLAYIIYTSGSTGTPKGVYQNHRGLLRDIMHCTETQEISCEDRLALFNSPTNISGLRVSLSALLNGATLDVINPRALRPSEVAREIRDRGITIFRSVPTLFRRVVEALNEGEVLENLRLVMLGGDRVDWRDFELFKRACPPQAHFGVHLGATECSTLYLEWYVDEFMPRTGLLPVGRSVPDRSVVLLDEDDRPVPDGEVGEFVVSSRHLALGYWRDPELTARAFSIDPVDPQMRVFRTGDLGRRRPDGLFEHVGRKDDQIKLRGRRIDPAEIESVLREHTGVREAAVLVGRDETGMPQSLTAYVELSPSFGKWQPADLKSMPAKQLPHYMIPARFQLVKTLPRLPNLKIDRVRLKELDAARRLEQREAASDRIPRTVRKTLPDGDSIAPSSVLGPLHLQIAEIWQRLVGRDIGFDENFFEIGGDSLLATQMICEVEAVTGQKIPQSALRTVFTVRELAATVMRRIPATGELVTCAKQGRGTPFFFCHGDYTTRGLYALKLVEMLRCDQPIYLIHPHNDPDPKLTIGDMARACLPQILSAHPTGVFRLGGHCNGGLLAWEIACQLERLDREVEFIALIDAPSVNARPLIRAIALLNRLVVATAPITISRKFALEGMRALWMRWKFSDGGSYSRAVSNYVPQKITSRIICLVSEDSRSKVEFSWRPWTNLAGDVSCRYISGTHLGCITQHVGDTARLLDRLINHPREVLSVAVGSHQRG
jgi:amino acid adenylation domain-containing protein